MKSGDLAELAARNLRESLMRTSLTTLGIGVGVASLVAMLSLGVGLQRLANLRLARSGLFDTVFVTSNREFRGPGRLAPKPSPAETRPLDESVRREIARMTKVVEVYPDIRFTAEVDAHGRSQFVTVAGLPPSARENDALEKLQGRFFSGPTADEALLHVDFARELADPPTQLIGQELRLRYAARQPLERGPAAGAASSPETRWGFSVLRQEKGLRIVGLVENEPGGGFRGPSRGRLFIPAQLAESLNPVQVLNLPDAMRSSPETSVYQSLVVRVASPNDVREVQDAVQGMGFRATSLLDVTRNLRRFFAVLDLFLGLFGSLALAVASLGIVNTLVMAILERRREIGIMKALGASDRDIRRLFFAEAAVMGFVGGTIGVTLGWALGRAINFAANIYLKRQDLPPETIWFVPWWLVAGAVAFSVMVSLGSGLYPAARAARLDPVQTLRYE